MSRLREKDPAKSPDKYAEQRMRDEEAQNDLRPDLEPEHAPANDRNEDDQREDPQTGCQHCRPGKGEVRPEQRHEDNRPERDVGKMEKKPDRQR